MQHETELEKVKARIRALGEKTISNGCTEAEAMSAAEMVGKLLSRYSLTMNEVELRAETFAALRINTGSKVRRAVDSAMMGIAIFCDCRIWLSKGAGGVLEYNVFGLETDRIMARYLYEVIDRAIHSEDETFKWKSPLLGGDLRQASQSFKRGMALRLYQRLMEIKQARDAEVRRAREAEEQQQEGNTPTKGGGLVIIKEALLDDAFKASKVKLATYNGKPRIGNTEAFYQGKAAGERVNLNSPLGRDGHTGIAA